MSTPGDPDHYAQPQPYGFTQPGGIPAPPQQQYPHYQQQQPYGQPGYVQMVPVVMAPVLPTESLAIASLICGIIGVLGGWCLFALPCLCAVILGHVALKRIATGTVGGKGMAFTGLILGYVFVIPAGFLFFSMVVGAAMEP